MSDLPDLFQRFLDASVFAGLMVVAVMILSMFGDALFLLIT